MKRNSDAKRRARPNKTTIPTRPNRFARWRAGTLLLVYILMAIHIAHWKLTGKTLAPLELNEVMHTLELGIVTAGFIFMSVVILATAIFGRFFCSWGCHILALQDLAAWLLEKVRIKPRPIRSRLLLWVPFIAATYMFVWPQISRIAAGEPPPTLRIATDADGWASFSTENFWRNLPGPGITVTTFFICGFVIVYVLGTRSFCAYGCPYGAIFGLVDRIAPGRIRVGDDCTKCGTCTAVCMSNVRVHEEVNRYGMVVNPACMKDLDCVSACPEQTLRFGFGRPSIFRRLIGTIPVKRSYDFSLGEEVVAAFVFVLVLLIYRGLYDIVPFLLTLALGALFSYGVLVLLRLRRRSNVALNKLQLHTGGKLTRPGVAFVVFAVVVGAFTTHSAMVRYSVFQGRRLYARSMTRTGTDANAANDAIKYLNRAQSWGLIPTPQAERLLGELYTMLERWTDAAASHQKLVTYSPKDPVVRSQFAHSLMKQGRLADARQQFRHAIDLNPNRAETIYGLACLDYQSGLPVLAEQGLRRALVLRPDFAEAHYELGVVLIARGALFDGIAQFRKSIRIRPHFGDAYYNLAVALGMSGDLKGASVEIERALEIQPNDEQTKKFREYLRQLRASELRAPTPIEGSETGGR